MNNRIDTKSILIGLCVAEGCQFRGKAAVESVLPAFRRARGYFNEIATFYNTRLEIVPDRFVAALGGLRPQALLAANEFERAPVEVNLTSIPATL